MKITKAVSRRYWVLGAYRDRSGLALHVYPCPCVRVTFSWPPKSLPVPGSDDLVIVA